MDDTAAENDVPLTGEVIEPDKTPDTGAPPPKTRRKRKQTETATINLGEMPDEIVEIVAVAPLILAAGIMAKATTRKNKDGTVSKGIQLSYDEGATAATVKAFKAWLATLNVDLTPGYALLAMYGVCISSAIPDALGQMATMQPSAEQQASEAQASEAKASAGKDSNASEPASVTEPSGSAANTAP